MRELEPVECNYRGYDIVSSPPPSSGGLIICEILNILEGYPISYLGYGSAETTRLMVEAMRHAYVDRNTALGDPDFVENPVDEADERRLCRGDPGGDRPLPRRRLGRPDAGGLRRESTETTHYSIIDKDGNAVAVTYTLNGSFGTGKVAEGTGVLLNNEMDDFTMKPGVPNLYGLVQGEANAIEPGKSPLSSMSPTIVSKDGEPFMVIGSPGGSRIITITLRGDHERDRPRHGPAGGDRRAAHPSPVAAGPGLHGAARAVARHAAHPRRPGLRRRHRPGLDDLGRGRRHPGRRPRPREIEAGTGPRYTGAIDSRATAGSAKGY